MIIQGDALSVLKTMPDKSVQCCVTSPPYYGLRDYGTGKWIGGDPDCPHRRTNKITSKTTTGHSQEGLVGFAGDAIYRDVCPLCWAKREDKQIGLELTPKEYINKLVDVFMEVHRVLKDDGTLWLNIGDSYCGTGDKGDTTDNINGKGRNGQTVSLTKKLEGYKSKDLIGIPWMLAFALSNAGWYLRQDIIWEKVNPMPEPVKDRCTKAHEYIFLMSKSERYLFNSDAMKEPCAVKTVSSTLLFGGKKYGLSDDHHYQYKSGEQYTPNGYRNKRDVWSVALQPFTGAHYAAYPEELIVPCILAGTNEGDTVLDPFSGAGTTGVVCKKNKRNYIGIELNPEYIEISEKRSDECDKQIKDVVIGGKVYEQPVLF